MTDLLKITVDSSDVARAQQDIKGLRKSTLDLEKSLKPLIRREKEFKRAVSAVNDAVRLGVANQRQANIALRNLAKQYGYTTKQVQRMNLALVQNTRSFKRFGSVGLQQVGYQVGDFAVQLQGGTNAFVAFGQQGSQLLGIFGPMGAIAGAVLAIFTAFAAPLSQMETGAGAAADEMKKLKGELEPIATMVKNLGSSLKDVAFDSIDAIANNLQKVISYAAAFAAVWIGRLGIVYGIKAATYAMVTFGSVSAGVFALIKRAIIVTGIGALLVLLGEAINVMLQLREATGSWGKAFGLVRDVVDAFIEEFNAHFANLAVSIEQVMLKIIAVFVEGLADIGERFTNTTAYIQARFDQMGQAIGNSFKTVMYEVAKAIDGVVDSALSGMQMVFDLAAKLPGPAGLPFRGASALATAGQNLYTPEQPTLGIKSFQDFFSENLEDMSKNRSGLRGTAVGLRNYADSLEKLKVETPLTAAAINTLEEALASVQKTGTFSMQALMDALAGTGDATELVTEQLDEQVEAWKKYQENIEKVLDSTELQLRQEISLIGLSKEEAELTKFIYALEKEMGATRAQLNEEQQAQYDTILALKEEYIQKTEAQVAANERLKQAEEKVQAVSKSLASETVGALKSIVNGTKTASEAFRDMALNIIQQIMDILIWQPLIDSLTRSISGALTPATVPGGSATGMFGNIVSSIFGFQKGGAFSAGNIIPFANGGVVNSPTMFGMSGGRTGLMGEAGPEAIMPLKRGSDGKLGVEGGGNVTVHQTFNFSANGDESVKKIIAQAAPKIAQMTEAKIINSRQRGGQMRRAFG